MAYTTINKSTDYMNSVLYTGNGGNLTVPVGFEPDLVWLKSRSVGSTEHHLVNRIRGYGTGNTDTPNMSTNGAGAEYDRNIMTASPSSGNIYLGNYSDTNTNSSTNVAWNWLGGGAGVSNTDGSITSTVSANTTSGFSVFTFTGTGSNGTVGHGLGKTPAWVIIKRVDASNNWRNYHRGMSTNTANDGSGSNTGYISTELTELFQSSSTAWNNTSPTSSVITVGTLGSTNASGGTMLGIAFAEIPGFSKMGFYEGNGNVDGPFVYTGFKPTWVMTKEISGTGGGQWRIRDNKRFDQLNPIDKVLYANTTGTESDEDNVEFLSNGFKLRTTGAENNAAGDQYLFCAFGQTVVGSNNIPCTAR